MVTKEVFGKCEQGTVDAYTITNSRGMAATILTLGGIIQKLMVPVNGKAVDVCLGYDTLEEYLTGKLYFGALIGRCANRIAGSGFYLPDGYYELAPNCGPHQLHGGPNAFDRKIWTAQAGDDSVTLSCTSPDGENGFPGTLETTVTYTLGEDNSLRIDYRAVSDKDTVVNMTNHAYFNLSGGSVLEDALWVDADGYTAVDSEGIPTGEIAPAAGTPLDFRVPKPLGRDIANMPQGCYDHNLCLNGEGLRKVARLESKGLTMEMETTEAGVQLYCANVRSPKKGKGGTVYQGNCFVCLEAQNYPDAIHHPHFPSPILRAGETYRQTTVYRFV